LRLNNAYFDCLREVCKFIYTKLIKAREEITYTLIKQKITLKHARNNYALIKTLCMIIKKTLRLTRNAHIYEKI